MTEDYGYLRDQVLGVIGEITFSTVAGDRCRLVMGSYNVDTGVKPLLINCINENSGEHVDTSYKLARSE